MDKRDHYHYNQLHKFRFHSSIRCTKNAKKQKPEESLNNQQPTSLYVNLWWTKIGFFFGVVACVESFNVQFIWLILCVHIAYVSGWMDYELQYSLSFSSKRYLLFLNGNGRFRFFFPSKLLFQMCSFLVKQSIFGCSRNVATCNSSVTSWMNFMFVFFFLFCILYPPIYLVFNIRIVYSYFVSMHALYSFISSLLFFPDYLFCTYIPCGYCVVNCEQQTGMETIVLDYIYIYISEQESIDWICIFQKRSNKKDLREHGRNEEQSLFKWENKRKTKSILWSWIGICFSQRPFHSIVVSWLQLHLSLGIYLWMLNYRNIVCNHETLVSDAWNHVNVIRILPMNERKKGKQKKKTNKQRKSAEKRGNQSANIALKPLYSYLLCCAWLLSQRGTMQSHDKHEKHLAASVRKIRWVNQMNKAWQGKASIPNAIVDGLRE